MARDLFDPFRRAGIKRESQVRLTIRMELTARFDRRLARLLAVLTPAHLEVLLRQAAIETVLVAIQQRFLKNLPGAVNMRRSTEDGAHARNPRKTRVVPAELITDALNAQRQASDAVQAGFRAEGDAERQAAGRHHQAALDKLHAVRARIRAAVLPANRSRNRLPSGTFRTQALQVLQMIVDARHIRVSATEAGGLTLEIGNRAELDKIRTPSATQELTGHPTGSPYQILWRHLEFGTGFYANPKLPSKFRLGNGGWWYGRTPGEALVLKGSEPLHALFDPARGLPYQADVVRFQQVFFQLLRDALTVE